MPLLPSTRCALVALPSSRMPLFTLFLTLLASSCILTVHSQTIFNSVNSTSLTSITSTRTNFRILTADSSSSFMTKVTQQYSLFRTDIDTNVTDVPPTTSSSAPRLAWQALQRGEGDLAIIPQYPTAADIVNFPDLMYLPFYATGFTPVYNVPEVLGKLTLSIFVLGRIYTGNITRWNDPQIAALNPSQALPNKGIEVVLQAQPRQLQKQFTTITGALDPYFAQVIPSATKPKWPTDRYAASSSQSGLDGPISYVLATPYTISMSYVTLATKLGANMPNMINTFGASVSPTYLSVSTGLNERTVQSVASNSTTGGDAISYIFNPDLNAAKSERAWPFIISMSLVIPRSFSALSCVQRSELVKFLRWAYHTDSIRYSLCMDEVSAMPSEEVFVQLGIESKLTSLTCDSERIADGAYPPITMSGSNPRTMHNNIGELLVQTYSDNDVQASYSFQTLDEYQGMVNIADPGSVSDLLWFLPMTKKLLYPDYYSRFIDSGLIQMLHAGVLGIIPQFKLHDPVRDVMVSLNAFPLLIDMETLALLFLGDINSWIDPRMLKRNPNLWKAFNQTGIDPVITLVFCGKGVLADNNYITNHFYMLLNKTNAFQTDDEKWEIPMNMTNLANELRAQHLPYFWVDDEIQMEKLIDATPGSIGYVLSFQNATNTQTDFQIVKTSTRTNGSLYEVTVSPTPASFLALAENSVPTQDPDYIIQAALSVDRTFRKAWPLPMLISVGVPTDLSASSAAGIDLRTICWRQDRAIRYASWLATDQTIIATSVRSGRAAVQVNAAWKAYFVDRLNQCTCDHIPILWNVPVIWQMSNTVVMFGESVSGIGMLLVIGSMVMLWIYRYRTIIRSGNILLQALSLLGILMLFITVFLYTLTPSNEVCNSIGWLLSLGVVLSFIPSCLKICKVYLIHSQNRKRLKVRKISTRKLQLITAAWIISHVIILAASQSSNGGMLTPQTFSKLENNVEHRYTQCSLNGSSELPYALIIVVVNGLMLFTTSCLAFSIRSITSAFNESRNISYSVWNMLIASIIIIPLLILTGGLQSDTGVMLLIFYLLWMNFLNLISTFGLRYIVLFMEELEVYQATRKSTSGYSGGSATGRSSGLHTHSAGGTGTGSGTSYGSEASSVFNFPSLDIASVSTLEKYITAIESQIRLARERRKVMFNGIESPVASGGLNGGSMIGGRYQMSGGQSNYYKSNKYSTAISTEADILSGGGEDFNKEGRHEKGEKGTNGSRLQSQQTQKTLTSNMVARQHQQQRDQEKQQQQSSSPQLQPQQQPQSSPSNQLSLPGGQQQRQPLRLRPSNAPQSGQHTPLSPPTP